MGADDAVRAGDAQRRLACGAADTLGRAQRAGALPAPQARRHRGGGAVELSRAAAAGGREREALRLAEQAWRADPDHPAAAICLPSPTRRRQAARGRADRRAGVDALAPSRPARRLRRARPVAEPLQWVKQVERLVRARAAACESLVALGTADLEAKLWGEARRHLTSAIQAGAEPTVGQCRLMARLEDEEKRRPRRGASLAEPRGRGAARSGLGVRGVRCRACALAGELLALRQLRQARLAGARPRPAAADQGAGGCPGASAASRNAADPAGGAAAIILGIDRGLNVAPATAAQRPYR